MERLTRHEKGGKEIAQNGHASSDHRNKQGFGARPTPTKNSRQRGFNKKNDPSEGMWGEQTQHRTRGTGSGKGVRMGAEGWWQHDHSEKSEAGARPWGNGWGNNSLYT